ncbi:MAG TPA: biopolymer transporter ExbB [Planctomycetaceae bacterium]|nr:biopolymer transporter ExbB [Planctomycetaceae bacterium]
MEQIRHFLIAAGLMMCVSLCSSPYVFAQPETEPAPIPVAPEVADEPNSDIPVKKSVIPTTPSQVVTALGWWGLPFGLATLISLWFSTERLVVLRRARVIPKPFVERFLHHLREGTIEPDEALQLCAENGSPVAQIFEHGVRKWGKPSVEVEQAIIDGGERQVSQMRKHLRVLNGVATVSPLIGLLGTVWGMIDAFNGVAGSDAMGSPEKLAAGIALALLTTAAGLMVAIPSLIIYMYLSGRVDRLVMDMDRLAQEVVYSISAEALHERSRQ